MKNSVQDISELSQALVTAFIPLVVYSGVVDDTDIDWCQFSLVALDSIIDICRDLGLNVSDGRDLALVVGSIRTSLFVVFSSFMLDENPSVLWERFASCII